MQLAVLLSPLSEGMPTHYRNFYGILLGHGKGSIFRKLVLVLPNSIFRRGKFVSDSRDYLSRRGEMAKAALREDLNVHSSVVSYSNDVLQLLSSEDLFGKTKDRVAIMETIRQRMDKAMDNLTSATKSMV